MDTALYYTFSTIAQSLAAAMALLAAFAMYRLNSISAECFSSAIAMEGQTGGGMNIRVAAIAADWVRVRTDIESRVSTQTYSYLKEEMGLRLQRLDDLVKQHGRVLLAFRASLGLTAVIMAGSIAVLAYVPLIMNCNRAQLTLNAGVLSMCTCLISYLWLLMETLRSRAAG